MDIRLTRTQYVHVPLPIFLQPFGHIIPLPPVAGTAFGLEVHDEPGQWVRMPPGISISRVVAYELLLETFSVRSHERFHVCASSASQIYASQKRLHPPGAPVKISVPSKSRPPPVSRGVCTLGLLASHGPRGERLRAQGAGRKVGISCSLILFPAPACQIPLVNIRDRTGVESDVQPPYPASTRCAQLNAVGGDIHRQTE